jgi:hypothetical protein
MGDILSPALYSPQPPVKLLLLVLTLLGIGGLVSLWWSGAFADAGSLPFWLAVVAAVSLVLPAVLLPIVVVRLPADYFVASRRELAAERSPAAWLWFVLRNLLGIALLGAGIALLFLPGQGVLTMFAGLLLLDVPGKRAVELRIVRRPAILAEINALRAKHGKAPLAVAEGSG